MPMDPRAADAARQIARRLKEARGRSGLSREAAAEKLSISVDTLRSWERGKGAQPGWALALLAELYGVTCEFLLAGDRSFFGLIDPVAEQEALETEDPERFGELALRLSVFVTDRLQPIGSTQEWADRLAAVERHGKKLRGERDEPEGNRE